MGCQIGEVSHIMMGVFVAGLLSADTAELSLDLAVLPWSFNYQWKHSQHTEAGLESVLIT